VGKLYKHVLPIFLIGYELTRKTRFLFGVLIVVILYALPVIGLVMARAFPYLLATLVCFAFSIYLVYRLTIRNVKFKYPIVSPEGNPDVYTGRMPRPIYEDMERYPWFFKKKRNKKLDNKKVRKKH
jgi:hypothetical protein